MGSDKKPSVAGREQKEAKVEGAWMVRPCEMYREEYRDCAMIRSRFHQLFTTGKKRDCSDWKEDYQNCSLWQKNLDYDALQKVINSEKKRVARRVTAVLNNDTWQLRDEPLADWSSPLPQHLEEARKKSALVKSILRKEGKLTTEKQNKSTNS